MNYMIFEKLNEVLNYLEDEESKMIIMQRFLYNVSQDTRYIFDIIKHSNYFSLDEVGDKYREMIKKYKIYINIDLLSFVSDNKYKEPKIVVFGCGEVAGNVTNLLNSAGVSIDYYCDNHRTDKVFLDREIITFQELLSIDQEVLVIIATTLFKDEIYTQLINAGVQKEKIYYPEDNMFLSFFGEPYFDKNILSPSGHEIFVDGGCYGGETALDFAKWCPDYDKIYAFEPDQENYIKSKNFIVANGIRDIDLFNSGLWSGSDSLKMTHAGDFGTGSFIGDQGDQSINVISLDQVLNGDPVTFIKLDIEGSELEALKGAKNSICRYKPKLAICIYHKPEDIIEIPLYIKSLVGEYKFKVRHYTSYLYDTILYCWI